MADLKMECIFKTSPVQLKSPDGSVEVLFRQKNDPSGRPCLYYEVYYKGEPVILESELDLRLDNHRSEAALSMPVERLEHWCQNLVVRDVVYETRDEEWTPVCGERERIRDHYNQMTVRLFKPDRPTYQMHLVFRAYDEGAAFRYDFPEDPTAVYYHIREEHTEFRVPSETHAWFTSWAQGPYQRLPMRDWTDESERPLTLELKNGLYVCLAEAQMVDYARTNFKLSTDKPDTIVTSLYGSVDSITPFGTPWRVILIARQPGGLIEQNDLILNLNPPCEMKDTSWIKPGKVIRDMTVSTRGAMACVDFAVAHHLQYVGIDWGWYGIERVFASDATKVDVAGEVNPSRDFDLHQVIAYGKQKGIGILLYVNQRALLKQLDEILPLYQSWGVAGVKFGFVQVGSHRWSVWLHEAVKKAAKHKLMVDIHDEYRPTGFSRTYPNLMTQEGIRGNEEMPDAGHNAILPFTRFIAGAADYTISYYKKPGLGDFRGKQIKTTSAHQLALAVIYYSPLQFLFWYDKPEDYQGEPEIEFFEKVPTVWDETRVLNGRIGEFVTMARRKGDEWFIGLITNKVKRSMRISLDFLAPGQKYTATIYRDEPFCATRTQVQVEHLEVAAGQAIDADLLPSGGQAIWIQPKQT